METNCSKAHLLNVVQLLDDALPRAATVFVDITRSSGRTISPCETVGENLIDRLASPLCWGQALRQSNQIEETEQESRRIVGYHSCDGPRSQN